MDRDSEGWAGGPRDQRRDGTPDAVHHQRRRRQRV